MLSRLSAVVIAAVVVFLLLLKVSIPAQAAEWAPAKGPLMTRWAKDVKPDNALPEYPRPQMVRKEWQNLNGLWDYSTRGKDEARPAGADGKILVPFPVESALSGVMKPVSPEQKLWYRRTFTIPQNWSGKRVLLHFGAVDWEAAVSVDGKEVGTHRGGYDPFSFDITDALNKEAQHTIEVGVTDSTNNSTQPRGKQVLKPGGIFYTAVTGIWQTVWMEPVPEVHVDHFVITPDVDNEQVTIAAVGNMPSTNGPPRMPIAVFDDGKEIVRGQINQPIRIPKPHLWSPEDPHLYTFRTVPPTAPFENYEPLEGYFAMRKISIGKDEAGVTRILLNNKFLFQYGPLDQGWWPDGLYTAPTDAALKYDIEVTKQLGFNMARKHVKVEPDRWYYWADKLGLLVWQDMPSGDKSIRASDPDMQRSPESAKQYEAEWASIINALQNHPSIVMWIPFNEGWGQFDTARIVDYTRKLDPTRLVNNTSGWSDRGVGDVHDIHVYPGPGSPKPEEKRAAVLGEFGGLGLPIEGHTWQPKGNWGYRSFTDKPALENAYLGLVTRLHRLIGEPGLSAAVYTQTTDVEVEVNGLMTYDREVIKIGPARAAAAAKALHGPPPKVSMILPDARTQPAAWKYTTDQPAKGWETPSFDDASWKSGQSGFGANNPPGSIIHTEWYTPQIWLRRTFDLPTGTKLNDPQLTLHHDEDADVFINGVLAAGTKGYTTGYEDVPISREAAATLKPGSNTIAIHVKQTSGGQYIDAGLVDVGP
jgi:hypothetical protein